MDLGRRWLAALMLVPQGERAALVAEMERRVTVTYAPIVKAPPAKQRARPLRALKQENEVRVIYPPSPSRGYTEQVEFTYEAGRPPARRPESGKGGAAKPRKRKGA